MKCNKCKKLIPNKEEIIIDKEYLHEECFNELEKEKQVELANKQKKDKKILTWFGFGLVAVMLFLSLSQLPFLTRERNKQCLYCKEVCKNTCKSKKSD